MDQIRSRSTNPQMQWFLRPPILMVALILSLYLIASITTPLNIDSMNSLDGKPIVHLRPPNIATGEKVITALEAKTNGTFPPNLLARNRNSKEHGGVINQVVNATSDVLVYRKIGDKKVPVGVDGAKLSQTAIRNRNTIQHFIPLSLFIVVGLIGIQIAKYYMMRRRGVTEGNATQFGGLAARSALSRMLQQSNVTRGLSTRLRNMTEADRVRLQLAMSSRDFTGDDYERLLQLDSASFNRGATDGQINRLPTSIYNSASDSSSNYSSPSRNRDMGAAAGTIMRRDICSARGGHGNSSSSSSNGKNNEWRSIDIDDREREGEQLVGRPTQCAICLEPYQDGDELRTVMCLHRFHKNCIDQWLRTNCICPICKQRSVE